MGRLLRTILIPIALIAALNWRTIVTIVRIQFSSVRPEAVAQAAATAEQQMANNTLAIPVLDLNAPVIPSETDPSQVTDWGTLRADLTKGVSLAEKLAKPGEKGTTVIVGHSSDWTPHKYASIFAVLDNLNTDDIVLLKYGEKVYQYKVRAKQKVDPHNTAFFSDLKRPTEKNRLALITCWPLFMTSQRLVVFAELVE